MVEAMSLNLLDGLDQDTLREITSRMVAVIEYGSQNVVSYQYERRAYDDLTSMGTPYTIPAAMENAVRSFNRTELASSLLELFKTLGSVPGNIRDILYQGNTHCYERSSTDKRCMRCVRCINYDRVIRKIINLPKEQNI